MKPLPPIPFTENNKPEKLRTPVNNMKALTPIPLAKNNKPGKHPPPISVNNIKALPSPPSSESYSESEDDKRRKRPAPILVNNIKALPPPSYKSPVRESEDGNHPHWHIAPFATSVPSHIDS